MLATEPRKIRGTNSSEIFVELAPSSKAAGPVSSRRTSFGTASAESLPTLRVNFCPVYWAVIVFHSPNFTGTLTSVKTLLSCHMMNAYDVF